jgi:ABC-2 type transport system ATP-binding protein
VLILDEPTSSLDPKQRAEVRDLIKELRGDHTVVLSTHILPEVSQMADRVFIINRGQVMAVDTPAHLGERLRGQEIVIVELQAPGGADDVRQALAGLAGVKQVTVQTSPRGTLEARVESAPGTDVRGDVSALVAARGWRLLGLQTERLSLEDIFLALTKDEQ